MLTVNDIEKALPATLKSSATQQMADMINQISADPDIAQNIRDNFVSYTSVLKDGKFKTEDYVSAVAYVSFKLMGDTNLDAWSKVFPQRYARLVANGAASKDIAAHVSAYNRGRLVNLILEQSLVPTWVLNQSLYQKAINTQAELMLDPDVSPKVRSDAANSLLTHLKKPEGKDFQINIATQDNSGMNELKQLLGDIAAGQQAQIAAGVPIKQITDAKIIEHRSTDGANEERVG